MKIAVCDDDYTICHTITAGILAAKALVKYEIYEFHSGAELLKSNKKWDMIFLDIELGGEIDGLDVAQKLQEENPELILIFISSFSKYVSSAYYFHTFQFLLKPIDNNLLQREFLRGVDEYKSLHAQYTFKHYYDEIQIEIKDIMYLEAQSRQLEVKTRNGKSYMVYGKISEQEELEKTHSFIRAHRSYLVNLRYIAKIDKNQILLADDSKIPISRTKRSEIADKYHEYLLHKK